MEVKMTIKPRAAQSRLDPEPMPRRDFLGLVSLFAAAAAMILAGIGMLKLPRAAVLSSPSKKFAVTLPDKLAEGEAFVPPGRQAAIFSDSQGVYAVSLICTHLGCVVKSAGSGFECPCHGSLFSSDGTVKKGPAPRSLPWLKVSRKDADLIIDEGETVPQGTKV
jgi:cytochrome b6-f complex iron-sulfur subunit